MRFFWHGVFWHAPTRRLSATHSFSVALGPLGQLARGPGCRGGRVGFPEILVRDVMNLSGPAQLGELASQEVGLGNSSQHTHSRLAPGQLLADSLAVGLSQSQALVVKRAQQAAAD